MGRQRRGPYARAAAHRTPAHSPAALRFLSVEPLLEDLGTINLSGISWVILGGESGHGARPMHPEWVRSIRDQCRDAGIPFFFKQWGGVRKNRAGRELDGRTYDEVPAASRTPLASARVARTTLQRLKREWPRSCDAGWSRTERGVFVRSTRLRLNTALPRSLRIERLG